ncbi:unnamed protein product [Ectocarpus sp. 13 AM-2016]
MCASFAPPKLSAAFTVGKPGQNVAEPARRRTYSSNGRRNRSPSPLARELLNGGRNAFSSEDAVTPLSTAGSAGGYHFGSGEGIPTPLSISQSLKARGGYSFNGGGDSATMPAALPMLSPTGDEGPASTGFSSTAASGSNTATAGVSNATAAANAIPTFSEITRGAIDRNGAVPLEPFARARVRAVEEGWARWAADRREREKRRRIRVLSVVTFLVLVIVLVCRRIGVGISISGPTATLPPGAKPSRKGGPGEVVSVRDLFSAAVHDMPAIVSSRDELAAVLKLAGIKKAKPEQVGRAWSALVSGEARDVDVGGGGGGGILQRYFKGGALAAEVLVAGVLRNAAAVALLAATLATVVAAAAVVSRGSPPRGQSRGGGFTCGTGRGGEAAANGGGRSSRARGGNRLQAPGGDGGCPASNGRANGRGGGGGGGGCAPRPGGDLRSPSPMSRTL